MLGSGLECGGRQRKGGVMLGLDSGQLRKLWLAGRRAERSQVGWVSGVVGHSKS